MRPFTDEQRRLVERHLDCALLFARRRALKHMDPHTRLSGALEGLMRAARAYDPSRGITFATLAWRCMTLAARREHWADRTIAVPERYGYPDAGGMGEDDRRKARTALTCASLSLDDDVMWDLPDESASPGEDPYEDERRRLADAVAALPMRERIVMRALMRGLRRTTIAAGLGVTRSRIGQLESRAVEEIRHRLAS